MKKKLIVLLIVTILVVITTFLAVMFCQLIDILWLKNTAKNVVVSVLYNHISISFHLSFIYRALVLQKYIFKKFLSCIYFAFILQIWFKLAMLKCIKITLMTHIDMTQRKSKCKSFTYFRVSIRYIFTWFALHD